MRIFSSLLVLIAFSVPALAQSSFVDVVGGRLHYEMSGSGEPIVLLHGNGGDMRHWDTIVEELATEYRVIRYDRRGRGQSPFPTAGTSYSNHGDLAALLDVLGIDRAHVLGWSQGSGIAIDFALEYPDRVITLISVAPWVGGYESPLLDEFSEQQALMGQEIATHGPSVGADAFVRHMLPSTITLPSAEQEFRRIAADFPWGVSNPGQTISMRPSAAARLEEISLPTLILTAEQDLAICKEIAAYLDNSLRNSQLVTMSDTGHLMHMEKPAEFREFLTSFLKQASAR